MERLNELIRDVRDALSHATNEEKMQMKRNRTAAQFEGKEFFEGEEGSTENFFEAFGGQGRTHFHYGVAHPIISGIETKFVANYGRDWLSDGHAARHAMVMGSRNPEGLKMFDGRMLWQISSALVLVAGTVFAAFILSWFTPTVGLGCRTVSYHEALAWALLMSLQGGYLVYIVLAAGLLVIELTTWGITHHTTHTEHDPLRRVGSRLERHFSTLSSPNKEQGQLQRFESFLRKLQTGSLRDLIKNFIIRPIEAANTVWLCYIVFAQSV